MSIVSKPLSPPNCCFICEHSNDVEYWDTFRYFQAHVVLPLNGRKYVCRECIATAAKEFGFLTPEDALLLTDRNALLESENKDVRLQSDLAGAIKSAAEVLAAGQPGIAATLEPVVIQSIPDVAKVKGAEIIDTTTPEVKSKK